MFKSIRWFNGLHQDESDECACLSSCCTYCSRLLTSKNLVFPYQYLTEFNSRPLELIKLSPLFSDDARVTEAAAVALKLRK